MHRDDPWMFQTRQDHGFLDETRRKISRAVFCRKNFERHGALQNGILRQPDCAHAALAQKLKRAIARAGEVRSLHFGLQAGDDLVW